MDEEIAEVGNQRVEAVPLVALGAGEVEADRVHNGEKAGTFGSVRGALVRVRGAVGDLSVVPCQNVRRKVVEVAFIAAAGHGGGFVLQSLSGDPQLLVVGGAFARDAGLKRPMLQRVQLRLASLRRGHVGRRARGAWHSRGGGVAPSWLLLLFLLFCACLNCAILNRSLEKVSAESCLSLAIG